MSKKGKYEFYSVAGVCFIKKNNKKASNEVLPVPYNWIFVSCEYGGMADTQ